MKPIILWGHEKRGCRLPKCSEREWYRIIQLCAFRCFYCSQLVDFDCDQHWPQFGTDDHLIPISRGGCHCRGNRVLSCLRCNTMKNKKTVAEFLNMKPSLLKTSGKFYTVILSLKPFGGLDPANDPLLNAISRLAVQKAFPEIRHGYEASYAWRHPA